MIIGIDASRANRQRRTGTEWYSFYLIKNLAKLDKENTYWLYLDEPISPDLLEVVKTNYNFVIKYLDWPLASFWTLGRLSWEMIWRAPEVLFIPAHTVPLIRPKRTVNTIHDIAFYRERHLYLSQQPRSTKFGFRSLANLIIKMFTLGKYGACSVDYLYWSTEYALKKAEQIISVSEFTKQEIFNFFPKTKPTKVQVVHNGYNSELYRPLAEPEKTQAILDKYNLSQPYFLYVGRLEKKKNTPMLIEALGILKEEHPEVKEKLVLIGNASFGFDEVKYVIEEFDLNHEVLIPGWVAEEDLPYIYNAAHAFIFPTRHEGFGIPILEALACNLPTVASDLPVLKEVAGEAVLYFDHHDKDQLAQAMYRIIKDESLRQELIAKGQEQVAKFSWEKCAAETLAVLVNEK
ncbi:MAG: glycosyltransferase family 4 protein [Patescibacteria group bacterium]|jgi:glycosyltransferase involved in cell wall biosynthesis